MLGYVGELLFNLLNLFNVISDQTLFTLNVLSQRDVIGDTLVSTFISINVKNGSYWNEPAFCCVLKLECALDFIYGVYDILTPVHQGQIISELAHNEVQCHAIKRAYHSPLNKEGIETLTCLILTALHSNRSSPFTFQIDDANRECKLQSHTYPSSWSMYRTECTIKEFYNDLRTLYNHY
jgi:hypothetical protein